MLDTNITAIAPGGSTVSELNILIIEDNTAVVANIFEYLESRGHSMDAAPNGNAGLYLLSTNDYDVVILDIMLPDMSGFNVCQQIRSKLNNNIPVLMLTAKNSLDDKVQGFHVGADDYLVKPFEISELECRLHALVKRGRPMVGDESVLRVADLTFNPNTSHVERGGHAIHLNPICRKILEILMLNSPNIVSRYKIESSVWGERIPGNDVLKSHIYTLRNTIDRTFDLKLIKTIPRTGYCISED